MSYYFVIVGTRDNPLYEADLASKPGSGLFGGGGDKEGISGLFGFSTPPQDTSATSAGGRGVGFGRYRDKAVLQMIAHSSLDVIEDVATTNGAMYLKSVDRINEWTTSAFVVPGNAKFLILHEHKHDDGIRNFFLDVWEAYLKVAMNPFHDANAPIGSAAFDARVKQAAKKHL